MIRQKPFARLIEEIRLLDFGANLQDELNTDMMVGLVAWARAKSATKGLSEKQISALIINVLGGWLFYLSQIQRGASVELLDRDTMLNEWATLWASILDRTV
jgi:hypothetical protein